MANKIKAERKPRVISKHIKEITLFTVAPSRDITFEYVKVFCIVPNCTPFYPTAALYPTAA